MNTNDVTTGSQQASRNSAERAAAFGAPDPLHQWSYLSHLECSMCGRTSPADDIASTCPECGKVLFARYDLAQLKETWNRVELGARPWGLWRYHEVLPVRQQGNVIFLGEGATPLIKVRPPRELGLDHGELLVKDEGQNPTGSFKSRGLAVAVSRARELGVNEFALPSAGNAGSAAAAYCAAAQVPVHVAIPKDAPESNIRELELYGADVALVDGLIDAAGAYIRGVAAKNHWFDLSTLKEPYRVEGKKTMGYELAEQGGFGDEALPDVIVYPAGGGTGIVGMWKAFDELEALGWIGSRRPRIVIVQADGCAPLVRAYHAGEEHAEPWENASTAAAGLRVPHAIGDYLILRAVRASNGTAVSVTDDEMRRAQREMARSIGILTSLEGAATYAALEQLAKVGFLSGDERVVLFATALGIK